MIGENSSLLKKISDTYSALTTHVGIWTSGLASSLSTGLSTISTIATNVSTLLSRLTATRAGYLDNLTNLDAAVSGTITGLTSEEKSGTLGIGTGTANVTVTSTTAGKRLVIGTYASQTPCTFEFTSATNVQVVRSVTDQICNYKFIVVRWN